MQHQAAVQAPVFTLLRQCARETGMRVYVIGGFVRDYLMGMPQRTDIDIVVEGSGIEAARCFASASGAEVVHVFQNFGTAMVRMGESQIEFVGARRESYRRNSRKPIVETGTLEDDQLRRDFTINALSISLNEADFGALHDPFGGLEDLRNGILRTPADPDLTFSDDPLRMLRAVRFAGRLGFRIEDRTFQSIVRNRQRIGIVSQERITDELNKIILAQQPSEGFRLLFSSGLLELIFPELQRMHGIDYVDGQGHKDNFFHTLQVLDNVAAFSDSLWLRWVAILHDIAKPLTKRYDPQAGWTFHGHEERGARMTPAIFRRFRLPLGDPLKYVTKLVRLHQRPIALVNEPASDSAIRRLVVEAGEDLGDLLAFCRADITSRNDRKVRRFLENYEALERRIREVEERDNLRNWQPPVTGEIIMQAFSLVPGPTVGHIKNEVREAILDGIIPNDLEAALAYMYQIAPKHLNPESHA